MKIIKLPNSFKIRLQAYPYLMLQWYKGDRLQPFTGTARQSLRFSVFEDNLSGGNLVYLFIF